MFDACIRELPLLIPASWLQQPTLSAQRILQVQFFSRQIVHKEFLCLIPALHRDALHDFFVLRIRLPPLLHNVQNRFSSHPIFRRRMANEHFQRVINRRCSSCHLLHQPASLALSPRRSLQRPPLRPLRNRLALRSPR